MPAFKEIENSAAFCLLLAMQWKDLERRTRGRQTGYYRAFDQFLSQLAANAPSSPATAERWYSITEEEPFVSWGALDAFKVECAPPNLWKWVPARIAGAATSDEEVEAWISFVDERLTGCCARQNAMSPAVAQWVQECLQPLCIPARAMRSQVVKAAFTVLKKTSEPGSVRLRRFDLLAQMTVKPGVDLYQRPLFRGALWASLCAKEADATSPVEALLREAMTQLRTPEEFHLLDYKAFDRWTDIVVELNATGLKLLS